MDIQTPSGNTSDTKRFRIAFIVAFSFALLLWALHLAEYLSGFDLTQFGVYPRRAVGLIGILCAPFIHGSVAHLFANTPPIIVIGTTMSEKKNASHQDSGKKQQAQSFHVCHKHLCMV